MLVVGKKLSKELAGYRVPSHGARAVLQLQAAGKVVRPGQRVRLLYTRGEPGVFAWDLPGQTNPDELDLDYYRRLLLRAASAVLQPFGIEENELENLVIADRGIQKTLWEIANDNVLVHTENPEILADWTIIRTCLNKEQLMVFCKKECFKIYCY